MSLDIDGELEDQEGIEEPLKVNIGGKEIQLPDYIKNMPPEELQEKFGLNLPNLRRQDSIEVFSADLEDKTSKDSEPLALIEALNNIPHNERIIEQVCNHHYEVKINIDIVECIQDGTTKPSSLSYEGSFNFEKIDDVSCLIHLINNLSSTYQLVKK